jgi:hypothetical protein
LRIQAKSKKAGGDSVSHKKTSGDVNEEAADEQEAGEKTAVKERFIYVSPAEKQIQRECSELHDVLQHSQARIVAEKTRRHRFLDSDRMSRSDLLAAKHAAFMVLKPPALPPFLPLSLAVRHFPLCQLCNDRILSCVLAQIISGGLPLYLFCRMCRRERGRPNPKKAQRLRP